MTDWRPCGVANAMSTNHAPGKHADWLRQTLAHDKKPLGVLLGAGCPAAIDVGGTPLIPHKLENRDNCVECHQQGPETAPATLLTR